MSRGIARWEYQDLVIPMTITVIHWRHPDYVAVASLRAQPLIEASLAEAARSGWHADEPTDFATLFSRSQVHTKDTYLRWRVHTVTIRLIRAITDEPLVPHG